MNIDMSALIAVIRCALSVGRGRVACVKSKQQAIEQAKNHTVLQGRGWLIC